MDNVQMRSSDLKAKLNNLLSHQKLNKGDKVARKALQRTVRELKRINNQLALSALEV